MMTTRQFADQLASDLALDDAAADVLYRRLLLFRQEPDASDKRIITIGWTCGYGHTHDAKAEAQACIDAAAAVTDTPAIVELPAT